MLRSSAYGHTLAQLVSSSFDALSLQLQSIYDAHAPPASPAAPPTILLAKLVPRFVSLSKGFLAADPQTNTALHNLAALPELSDLCWDIYSAPLLN